MYRHASKVRFDSLKYIDKLMHVYIYIGILIMKLFKKEIRILIYWQ